MEELLIPIVVSLASSMIQRGMNRSDFDYTLSKTNTPAQVSQFRQAGLNPALAYGQISSPQAQSLGNYQMDFGKTAKDIAQLPQVKQQIETSKAQENYYNALAQKTNEEANEVKFRVSHQDEVYHQEFEFRALRNVFQNLENSNTYYRNIGQIAQNGILAVERQIRDIDLAHHEEEVHSRIQQLTAAAFLDFALGKTENTLRDARLANLRAQTRGLVAQMNYTNAARHSLELGYSSVAAQSRLLDIQRGYMDFITKNNTDFSTLNARERWNIYGDDIFKGIMTAAGILGAAALRSPVFFTSPSSSSSPSWNDYGPGRDNLGH